MVKSLSSLTVDEIIAAIPTDNKGVWDRAAILKALGEAALCQFDTDSVTAENRHEVRLQALGTVISNAFHLKADVITVFLYALEDANMHKLAEEVSRLTEVDY